MNFNHQQHELSRMQSQVIFNELEEKILRTYGEHRMNEITQAFNNDKVAILKCFISLLA